MRVISWIKNIIKYLRIIFLLNILWRKYKISSIGFHCGLRVKLWAKNKLIIGDNFFIGHDSFIATDCEIGKNVMFGNKVAVIGKYDHNFEQVGVSIRKAMQIRDEDYDWHGKYLSTKIGSDVWIGYGSTILQGVTIGDGAIIGACSLVVHDIEPYSIYVGNPARKIRNRFITDEQLDRHLKTLDLQHD